MKKKIKGKLKRFILLVTVAHNPLRKVEFRYKISKEGKESYIGDFKCVLGNYVDS